MTRCASIQRLLQTIACLFACSAIAAASGARAADAQPSEFVIRNGDRVVFYGDSITDNEWYPTLVETYVLTRFPEWRNHFANRGVSGDNSGSIARFERDCLAQKADVITYNMGFNDGGYAELDSGRLERWLGNVEKTVALARQANPAVRLVLASPIPNEVAVSTDSRWVSHETYPATMLAFGRAEEQLARRLDVPFVNVGLLYGQSMGLGQVAAGESFKLSRDGVHPQREGQTLIAFHLLRGLHAGSEVASLTIDAAGSRMAEARGCVADVVVKDGVVSVRRTCQSLPYPTPPEVRPFGFLVGIDDQLSDDRLVVTGLAAAAYTLFIDDRRIADIPAAELAAGINLSRYPATPMYEQAVAVMDAVRRKQVLETGFWRQFITSGKADGRGEPGDKATPEDRAAIAAARQAIAAAEAACYAANAPKAHTIRLEPSSAKVARYAAETAADINRPPLKLALPPIEADWNRMKLLGDEIAVAVSNPAAVPQAGTLRWACPQGWSITPIESPISLAAGGSQTVTFKVSAADGDALLTPPEVTARWRWSEAWPYPRIRTQTLELTPRLTINRAEVSPSLTGASDEWRDATSFPLAASGQVNPAVPGKRLLWNGPADLSARVFLKWDASALYVAALVRDDDHLQDEGEAMMWSKDVVMTAFLMREPGKADGRYEFGFGAHADRDIVARYTNAAKDATGPEIRFASRVDRAAGTCLYEMVIPWGRLPPFDPVAGKSFRFTLCVGDADAAPGKGFNYLAWTPGISYGKNPADFAWITLGEREPTSKRIDEP
jgi:lysophospholipase L1-like esterase